MGDFCVGQPFSEGSAFGNALAPVFKNGMVSCGPTDEYTNQLGQTYLGSAICEQQGRCLPSYQVRDAAGVLFCEQQPLTGYIRMCDPNIESCAGVDPEFTVDTDASPLDYTRTEDPTLSPYVIPALCDDAGLNCKQWIATNAFTVPDDNGFSVNNKLGTEAPPANVIEGFQSTLASLKFYLAADKNHIPIRFIELDWGDGLSQTRVGYYKNHLDQCGDPNVFGPITFEQSRLEYAATEQACREAFRNYLHVYSFDQSYLCGRCENNPNRECGRDADCFDYISGTDYECQNQGLYGAISCYRPRVMVQDNWGWCTNGVYGETGLGCKEAGVDPLPQNVNEGYIRYQGIIKVYKDAKP
jgi:hypothetical protein